MDPNIISTLSLFIEFERLNKPFKGTLSIKRNSNQDYIKVFFRSVLKKNNFEVQVIYKYDFKEITKIFRFNEWNEELIRLLSEDFKEMNLATKEESWLLKFSKKNKTYFKKMKNQKALDISVDHNKNKKRVSASSDYLVDLGILNKSGNVVMSAGGKLKQIRKYIEILSNVIEKEGLLDEENLRVVDMGSGKAYLSFALYDYLSSKYKGNLNFTGVEIRSDLVEKCQQLAVKHDFNALNFVESSISEYKIEDLNILIALHACDTATDDAIIKGIEGNANLIVVAPCCHKQLRKSMNISGSLEDIARHGILEERLAEMATDSIRALIMESFGYQTKVFEFISNEHTSKNIMIIGVKTKKKIDHAGKLAKLKELKSTLGISHHYLEKILN